MQSYLQHPETVAAAVQKDSSSMGVPCWQNPIPLQKALVQDSLGTAAHDITLLLRHCVAQQQHRCLQHGHCQACARL
jgi:hypothetical protein